LINKIPFSANNLHYGRSVLPAKSAAIALAISPVVKPSRTPAEENASSDRYNDSVMLSIIDHAS
jgi:hypothetical protein